MLVPLVVGAAAVAMMTVEWLRPGRPFPQSAGWVARALLLNGAQCVLLLATGRIWDAWLRGHRPWSLDGLGIAGGAVVGYVVHSFIYYWWHRARHASPLLWRWVHQVHHSPARITILTSFYKHPLEILLNSLLSSLVLYALLGLGPEAALGTMLLNGLAELWYHWNIRTPRWLGYLLQRPESHCVHHERDRHAKNYGDLPVFDLLFGTFENPGKFEGECGFGGETELRLPQLLRGRDLSSPRGPKRAFPLAAALLFAAGMTQMLGDVLKVPVLKGLGAAAAMAPAPRVFGSVRGYETFSTGFALEAGSARWNLTPERYAQLRGPYNRRNVYGAALSYGPVLPASLRDPVLRYALCGEAPLLAELGLPNPPSGVPRRLRYTPVGDGMPSGLPDTLEVRCP
jgi:sterol desaturase/sphingolipid hydroxylase (fatty acid hydroxylase superfamily)